MKRKTRMGTGAAATAAVLIGTGVITSAPASAHGYVEGPLSRSAACNIGLNTDCGSIVYEPQSLEALKGFPKPVLLTDKLRRQVVSSVECSMSRRLIVGTRTRSPPVHS